MLRVELVDPAVDSLPLFVLLECVIESIFRYLKHIGNELPQPADVPSVPASTIIAVNRTMESTLSQKVSLELQSLKLQDQIGHRQVRCSYGTSSAVRKYSKAYVLI